MQLSDILKDSDYKHAQFDLALIHEFEQRIIVRTDNKGKKTPYINCLIRKKDIRLTPEEAIRQLYLEILLNDYKYPADRIELEYAVTFGRE
ncbi:MAG: type I restriction enzyme HsdR N-terminal domain-containing protein, partial [Prevotellaceae bacterium]|nr:type I restriction enzyme HsdR N-terminal domain-containing protein [Prevotellaceae bacterium]